MYENRRSRGRRRKNHYIVTRLSGAPEAVACCCARLEMRRAANVAMLA